MNILIIVAAVCVVGLPTAVWFVINARRAERAQPPAESAPAPHYGGEQAARREPNLLGKAWARTTTSIE